MSAEGAGVGLLNSALEHLRPSLRTVAAFAVAYLCLLLTPQSWAIRSTVFGVLGNYVVALHGAGFLSIAYLATFPVSYLWSLKEAYRGRKHSRIYLHSLSPEEKRILNRFVQKNRKAVALDLTNGDVMMLETQRIIGRLTTISKGGTRFDMSIQPWAFEYLKKNPQLLEGAADEPGPNSWLGD